MSFSSGTYSLYATGNPVVTNTTISSTWANNTLNDIATALSTCLLKDGTQTATAAIPFAEGITIPTGKTLSGAGAINISGNITGAAGSFTTGTFSGNITAQAAINVGAAALATNFIGMNRTSAGAILNSGIVAYDFYNTGSVLAIERYTGAGAADGSVTIGAAGAVTLSNLAGVGNRYAYVDANGLLIAGAAYP